MKMYYRATMRRKARHALRRWTQCAQVLLAMSALIAGAQNPGRRSGLRPMTIAGNGHSGIIDHLPLDIAFALHYFEDEGLSPHLLNVEGASAAASAVLSGKAQFSVNSLDHAMALNSKSVHLVMVASFTHLPSVSLLVRRPQRGVIRSVKDLRGHSIGISAISSGTYPILNSILEDAGLTPASVHIVPLGVGDQFINAVRSGKVDAAITTDPTALSLLIDANCSLLLDLVTSDETQRIFHGDYQFTGLLTRSDTIEKDPALVQSAVNAVSRAEQYLATHSAAEIASVLPPQTVGDRFLFIKSIQHTRSAFSPDARMRQENIDNSITAYEHASGRRVIAELATNAFAERAAERSPANR